MEVPTAATALGAALRHDPLLAVEPDRLGRALTDLLPYDEGTVRLLTSAAEAGVPELVRSGRRPEAHDRLTEHLGLRADVADQVVAAWSIACGRPTTPGPAPRPDGDVAERPGPPTGAALLRTPSGEPLIAVVSGAGVYTAVGGTDHPRWRTVATPPAPTSRDVALAGDRIVWTGPAGVEARTLTAAGGGVSLGDERLIAPATALEPRYPLTAFSTDDGRLDVLWTTDRTTVAHTGLRDWEPAAPVEVPAWPDGRLTALAADYAGGRDAWLVARSDTGTVAAARWDLSAGIGRWTPLSPPVPLSIVTVVADLAGSPAVLGFTADGHAVAGHPGGLGGWHSVDMPGRVGRPRRAPQAIAAAGGDPGWLLVADGADVWLAVLGRAGGVPKLSDARPLAM
jgi:hypothetical protein